MKTVFITRQLSENSIFKRLLENAGLKVFGESLIQFSAISFQEIPKTDWIFFYSKNGVKFFFQGIRQSGLKIPENVKWAAIGTETAKALTSEFREPDFIGNGVAEQTAASFLKIAKGQKVLFPQAKISLQSIQQNIGYEIVATNLIVYKNITKKNIKIPATDFIAFTSPLNVKIYFEKKQTATDQKLFAIGQTTANSLVDLGIYEFETADAPSEESLAKAIIKSLKSDAQIL